MRGKGLRVRYVTPGVRPEDCTRPILLARRQGPGNAEEALVPAPLRRRGMGHGGRWSERGSDRAPEPPITRGWAPRAAGWAGSAQPPRDWQLLQGAPAGVPEIVADGLGFRRRALDVLAQRFPCVFSSFHLC